MGDVARLADRLVAACNTKRDRVTFVHGPFKGSIDELVLLLNQQLSHLTDYGGSPLKFAPRRLLEEGNFDLTKEIIVVCEEMKDQDTTFVQLAVHGTAPHILTAHSAMRIVGAKGTVIPYQEWCNALFLSPPATFPTSTKKRLSFLS